MERGATILSIIFSVIMLAGLVFILDCTGICEVGITDCARKNEKHEFYYEEVKEENEEIIGYCLKEIRYSFNEMGKVVVPSEHNGKPVIGIKEGVFYHIVSLKEVVLPDQIKEIGASAFAETALERINLPKGLERIEERAFAGTALKNITIPDSVTYLAKDAFEDTNIEEYEKGVYYVDNWVIGYDEELTDVELREETVGIASWVFGEDIMYTPQIKNVVLNDELRCISENAFNNCEFLTIQLPETLEYIGSFAFYDCKLINVVIPEDVIYIGDSAFENCVSITGNIIISENIKYLGQEAFRNCSSINSVVLPETVRSIAYGLFYNCLNLSSISGTENLKSIGAWALGNCKTLTDIELADNVELGKGAFSGCGFTSFEYPVGCNVVPASCFSECASLVTIEVHDGITEIGKSAFKNCTNLTSIEIPLKVEIISENMFEGCTGLFEVILSEKIKTIGEYSFYNCKLLTSITFPSRVDLIYKGAFQGSGLQSVIFDNNYGWFFCDSVDSDTGTKISANEMEDSTRASEIFISKMNSKYFKRSAK